MYQQLFFSNIGYRYRMATSNSNFLTPLRFRCTCFSLSHHVKGGLGRSPGEEVSLHAFHRVVVNPYGVLQVMSQFQLSAGTLLAVTAREKRSVKS